MSFVLKLCSALLRLVWRKWVVKMVSKKGLFIYLFCFAQKRRRRFLPFERMIHITNSHTPHMHTAQIEWYQIKINNRSISMKSFAREQKKACTWTRASAHATQKKKSNWLSENQGKKVKSFNSAQQTHWSHTHTYIYYSLLILFNLLFELGV